MAYEINSMELLTIMEEFCRKLGSQHDQMPIDEFGKWRNSNGERAFEAAKMYLQTYGDESSELNNSFLNEYDMDESEIRSAIELKKSFESSERGRPSKVEKWQNRIEDGSATLEDARQDMSDPTWYKLKQRVEE